MSKIKLDWRGNMSFSTELNGHEIIIDADDSVGGKDQGPRPKPLVLVALGGCTGMDVVSILRKMRVKDYKLAIEVNGEMTTEHPKYYKSIVVNYNFKGKNLPEEKIKKAVNLSETRYCGVTAMLSEAAEIKNNIFINGNKL